MKSGTANVQHGTIAEETPQRPGNKPNDGLRLQASSPRTLAGAQDPHTLTNFGQTLLQGGDTANHSKRSQAPDELTFRSKDQLEIQAPRHRQEGGVVLQNHIDSTDRESVQSDGDGGNSEPG